MKKMIFLMLILIPNLFLVSCSAPQQAVTTTPVEIIIEKERVINKPFETIWLSTIELLATYNMPIKNLDKSSGFIASDYKFVTSNPGQYMLCTGANSTFSGKVELVNHGGNLNILIKKISEDSTKITINCFWSCVANKYRYASLFSTDYVLESSNRQDCNTSGNLEKAFLDYLSMP
jgi:hypothetical protein